LSPSRSNFKFHPLRNKPLLLRRPLTLFLPVCWFSLKANTLVSDEDPSLGIDPSMTNMLHEKVLDIIFHNFCHTKLCSRISIFQNDITMLHHLVSLHGIAPSPLPSNMRTCRILLLSDHLLSGACCLNRSGSICRLVSDAIPSRSVYISLLLKALSEANSVNLPKEQLFFIASRLGITHQVKSSNVKCSKRYLKEPRHLVVCLEFYYDS
jgi:hypothetical protein